MKFSVFNTMGMIDPKTLNNDVFQMAVILTIFDSCGHVFKPWYWMDLDHPIG